MKYGVQFLFLFLMVLPRIGYAQDARTGFTANDTVADAYREKYADYIKLRLGISNGFHSYNIKTGPVRFNLTPNQRIRTNLTVMYKFIEVDIGYTPRFLRFNNDDDLRGSSTFSSLGTRFYVGRWMQNLQFSRTRGYYVDRKDIGTPGNILFPDFRTTKIGGSTAYIFNPNFSFRSISIQSEWQKKSVGSFLPSVSYYVTEVKSGDPGKDRILDIAMGPAYFYNLLLGKRFMVSGGVYGGIGYNHTWSFENDTVTEQIKALSFQSQFRLALYYNTENFYMGAIASLESFYYNQPSQVQIQDRETFFECYFGYRFKAPNRVSRTFKKYGL